MPESFESRSMPAPIHAPIAAPIPGWLEPFVRFMDDGLPIPGTRFRLGWDAIIGFVLPGAGDALAGLSHIVLIACAFRIGAPRIVMARMALYATFDMITGVVPVAGDAFDAVFKANRKNLELLQRVAQAAPARRAQTGDYVFVMGAMLVVLAVALAPFALLAALIAHWT